MKIIGLIGFGPFYWKDLNIPKEWCISGYMTDEGTRYSINQNGIIPLELLTLEQIIIKAKIYNRKLKLDAINKS